MFKFFKSSGRVQSGISAAEKPPEKVDPATDNATSPGDIRAPIDTWDVFDTLIARYCTAPAAVHEIVAQRTGVADFPVLRKQAQDALDSIGKPYVIFEIYRRMRDHGLDAVLAERLLAEELAVESEQVIPIRRCLERVGKHDILVSDMYLTGEMIADLLAQASDMGLCRPVTVGNWGKASGAIWGRLLRFYRINMHHGDNTHSDHAMPGTHQIPTELVQDHLPTAWEQRLIDAGESQLALLSRECRLRSTPSNPHPIHGVVCGPLLAVMAVYAAQLRSRYREATAIVFCSRDCDQLGSVFRAMFPAVPTLALDLNRLLTAFGTHDAYFNERLPDGTVIVDLVGSGRSILSYMRRNPGKKLAFHSLVYVDDVLDAEEKAERAGDISAERFLYDFTLSTFTGPVSRFEVLLQAGYDKVVDVIVEPDSGAVVRHHERESWSAPETEFLEFKSFAMQNLVRSIKQRPIDSIIASERGKEILELALREILGDEEILNYPSTYHDRDRIYFRDLVAMGNQLALGS